MSLIPGVATSNQRVLQRFMSCIFSLSLTSAVDSEHAALVGPWRWRQKLRLNRITAVEAMAWALKGVKLALLCWRSLKIGGWALRIIARRRSKALLRKGLCLAHTKLALKVPVNDIANNRTDDSEDCSCQDGEGGKIEDKVLFRIEVIRLELSKPDNDPYRIKERIEEATDAIP